MWLSGGNPTAWPGGRRRETESGGPAERREKEEYRKNDLGVFTGETAGNDESGFSIGGDYERRLSFRFGIGADGEWTGGTVREAVFLVPVYLHITKGLRFGVGPGFAHKYESAGEEAHGGGEAEPGGHGEGSGTHFLTRLTASYSFEVKSRYSISPSFSVDFTNGHDFTFLGCLGVSDSKTHMWLCLTNELANKRTPWVP